MKKTIDRARKVVASLTLFGAMAGAVVIQQSNRSTWLYNTVTPSAQLVISANGNVGIGTTTPNTNLHIKGSNPYIAIQNAGGQFGIGLANDSNEFVIWDYTDSTRRLNITSSGNVGIGTATPLQKLSLGGVEDSIGWANAAEVAGWNHDANNAGLLFKTTSGGAGAQTTKMTVLGNGNVGIGTTTPQEKLHVSGNIAMSPVAADRRYFILDNTNTGTGMMVLHAGAGSSGYGGALNLYAHAHATRPGWATIGLSAGSGGKFTVNDQALGDGTDVFTVQQNGNVGIGTTVPQTVLEAVGAITIRNQGTGSGTSGLLFSDPDSLGEFHSMYLNEGDNSLRISSYEGGWFDRVVVSTNGNIGIGTTAPSTKLDVSGTVSASALVVNGDIQTAGSNAFYFGDSATDGTWRIIRSENNLVFQRRESGAWVDKSMVLP